ncbi:MAG: response regulator, partial [Polyangiales bacterium]
MTPTVLVVEDNESLADNIAELFEDIGATVQVRSTASSALDYAQNDGFDLAIVDIGLPGGQNGLALVPELRDLTPDGEVILMTGNASLDSTIAAVRHGAF